MTKTVSRVEQVKGLIPFSSEHPITAKKISKITNIPLREVYAIIRYLLIHAEIPIGALRDTGKHGYFIITSEDERIATLAPLKSHANEIEKRISAIKNISLANS